jgi:hydroxyquinol 1,2-dioxygenase
MRDLNEHTITDAVLDRFANTPNPRLKTLVQALVRHLHGVVRETEPTFEEWQAAIDFLTRTGQMCSDVRQEFILLSDVLGVSMLVDAINHRQPAGATESTVLGPFHVAGAPQPAHGADISAGLPGERLLVEGVVTSADGDPVPGAVVEVWSADQDGFYDVQRTDLTGPALRATFHADQAGRFHFWTVMPADYPIPDDGPVGELLAATARHPYRPAHVHFMISAPGYERLVTHIFAEGSPYIESDAVFGVKSSLIEVFETKEPGTAPDGRVLDQHWRRLTRRFGLKRVCAAAPATASSDHLSATSSWTMVSTATRSGSLG